jgi:group I intron endonuclease
VNIYVVTNRVNGKRYVGQTRRTVARRWQLHSWRAARGAQTHFERAIQKHGPAAFGILSIPLASWTTQEQLDRWERWFIAALKTQSNGYNIEAGGHGHSTIRHKGHSAATRAKMRESAKGRDVSKWIAASPRNKRGYKPSPESVAKQAASNRHPRGPYNWKNKYYPTAEHREAMRARFAGVPLSDEHRAKLRAAWVFRKEAR